MRDKLKESQRAYDNAEPPEAVDYYCPDCGHGWEPKTVRDKCPVCGYDGYYNEEIDHEFGDE